MDKKRYRYSFKEKKLPLYTAIYEIGGVTGTEGICKQKFTNPYINSSFKIQPTSKKQLSKHLETIQANDSGATDIGGALIQVAEVLSQTEDESNYNREIIILTDSDQSCEQNKNIDWRSAIQEIKKKGFIIDEDRTDNTNEEKEETLKKDYLVMVAIGKDNDEAQSKYKDIKNPQVRVIGVADSDIDTFLVNKNIIGFQNSLILLITFFEIFILCNYLALKIKINRKSKFTRR